MLFCHDEEIIGLFQEQFDSANQRISSLEESLRTSNDNCDFVGNKLHESEIALNNEAHLRLAFQRHLRLEQYQHNSSAEALHTLQLKHNQAASDLDAANILNAMLHQEIEHSHHIINSMASKIAEYELSAQRLSVHQSAEQAGSRAGVEPHKQDDGSKASSGLDAGSIDPAGSPGSASPRVGGTHIFISESPQLPSTGLGTESQTRLANRETKVARLGRVKASRLKV